MDASQRAENDTARWSVITQVFRGIVHVVKLLTAAAVVFSLLGFLARWWWPLELLCHFRLQYAWTLSLAALVFWSARSFRWAMITTAVMVLNGAWLVPYLWPAPHVDADGRDVVSVLIANVHTANRQLDRFLSLVESESPDVVVVMEVDAGWIDDLSSLRNDYPFCRLEPRGGNFGMALYSRRPLKDVRTIDLGGIDTPAIGATVPTDAGDISLLAIHPLPPVRHENARLRNLQLKQAVELLPSAGTPSVVVGDFNATPWSPAFRDLLREGNLRDARTGRGLLPTWPVQFPSWLLRLPIDHAVVSEAIDIHDFRTLGDIGSDHLPLRVDVSLPNPGP